MNTAKKRILSLTLTICLALSMMLTLSACGKKNLEEYFNTDTMQKLVTSSVEQYESQGMELKMYAEGDELHYDLTLTTIETTDDDRSVYAEALEAGLAETGISCPATSRASCSARWSSPSVPSRMPA